MSRYHIAMNKPPPRESKILKPLLNKLKLNPKKLSGGQDSSAHIAMINNVRRDSSSSSQIRGETGLPGVVPGITGVGITGAQGLTGSTQSIFFHPNQGSSEYLRIDPDSGRVGIGSPPPGTAINIQGEGVGIYVQEGSDEGIQVQTAREGQEAFFHDGDSIETPRGPISQFFTVTGPNGFRIMVPLRRFNFDVRVDAMDFNRSFFNMRLATNQAIGMQEDINAGRERLGLRNEPL